MRRLLLLFLIIPLIGNSQKVKYKDVFPILVGLNDEEEKQQLLSFLSQEPDHPNANFRLALIYENGYKKSDKLTEYKRAIAFAKLSQLRFGKSKLLVDQKEISRNEEYYTSFSSGLDKRGRPEIKFETVSEKMTNGYDSAQLLIDRLPPIYENFTAAVNSYGKAHHLFYGINNKYRSLDDLYMLYDEELEVKLLELKAAMDTSISHLKLYRELINTYPVDKYNQEYELVPITYYRLDGLEELSNILNNKIKLWDYSNWVDRILMEANTDITNLRSRLIQYDNTLNTSLANLLANRGSTIEKIDKELIYQLRKYDYQSVIVSLLEYKQYKQNLIKKQNQKIFYDTATQLSGLGKFNFYSDLLKQTIYADSMIALVVRNNSPDKVEKHKSFIQSHFQGPEGLAIYLNKEKDQMEKDFNYYKLTLRNDLIDELNFHDQVKPQWVNYKREEIPLFINTTDSISTTEGKIVVSNIDFRADSVSFIGGYKTIKNQNKKVGFLARVDPGKKVTWVKEFDIPVDSANQEGSSKIVDIEVTKDGCAFILRSVDASNSTSKNMFFFLDDEGSSKISTEINVNEYPRSILLDQNNSRFILTFKDRNKEQQIINDSPLHIVAFNTLGDKLWERQISFAGSFTSIASLQEGYLIIGNYTHVKDTDGKSYRTKGQLNETNAFALKLSTNGDINMVKAFEQPGSYFISDYYKVNDGNINLFGLKGTYNQDNGEISYNNDNLIHLMIDKNLKELKLVK